MAGPYLPIQAVNRSQKVRIGKGANAVLLQPNVTSYVDTSDGNVRRDLQRHSAVGAYIIVGPLSYTQGAGSFLRSTLATTPATIANTETKVLNLAIPASVLQVGTIIDIEARGTLSAASAGTLNSFVRLGTAGTTADASVCSTGATGAATTAVGWTLDAEVEVRSIGAGSAASVLGNARVTVGATALGHAAQSATVTFDSTLAQFVNLTFQGGGTTPVVTVNNANIKIFQ